jgi:hypothetical protein
MIHGNPAWARSWGLLLQRHAHPDLIDPVRPGRDGFGPYDPDDQTPPATIVPAVSQWFPFPAGTVYATGSFDKAIGTVHLTPAGVRLRLARVDYEKAGVTFVWEDLDRVLSGLGSAISTSLAEQADREPW